VKEWTRREWLAVAPAGAAMAVSAAASGQNPSRQEFGFCFNTSTIQGQKLTIEEEVSIASRAGYQGIEPWVRELEQHERDGRSLADLGKRIRDAGLGVESAIAFFEWAVDDEDRRRKGLEQAKGDMEKVQKIGGKRIAAPPVGATDRSDMDLRRVAERYRALLELGQRMGVVPQAEVWGFSRTLGRLSEAAFVAIESGHPAACILPDVFHLYKGGSAFAGMRLLGPESMHVFHFNDYPASPPRAEISDAQRVYPGDGVAPLADVIRALREIGFHGVLSLELFNRDYWKQDAFQVARTGLEKMRAVVQGAFR
jgi:sugar phosphate isomerase/epimerase